jgi:hypothetical protein
VDSYSSSERIALLGNSEVVISLDVGTAFLNHKRNLQIKLFSSGEL